MMRVFVDTNITIDLLARRQAFYPETAILFSKADKGELTLLVSALTFANTHYILNKQLSVTRARQILLYLKTLVVTISLNERIIDLALSNNEFKDFEDGLQFYSALEGNADVICTRNKKDFRAASIPVLTAKEVMELPGV